MLETRTYPQRWYDGLLGYFFRLAASGLLPARWFRERLPAPSERKAATGKINLEIVTHCWQYASMLAYQLSSLVNYPPTRVHVTVTVFHAEEDRDTTELLAFFAAIQIPAVAWNWQPLPKEKLFRRGIGRNMAARATTADWVWYTDCDIIFHRDSLDILADQLQGRRDTLLFPRQERTTPMLAASDPMLQKGRKPRLVDIDAGNFSLHARDRAKGAFQIVHGDVARAIGYCAGISLYQTPAAHWCKCYEDRAFRWLAGTRGEPIDVPGIYQIRHIHKGRYKKDAFWSTVRSKIRRLQE